MSQSNRGKRKHILSSLTALGESEPPVTLHAVARPGVIASVAAAGVSLLACQAADADTITLSNPNVNIGFAAGALSLFAPNISSAFPFHVTRITFRGKNHSLGFVSAEVSRPVFFRISGSGFAATAVYGKKFSQVGSRAERGVLFATATSGGNVSATFSKKYFDFSFTDASSQTHYGWIYGSVTGGYSDLNYNLISYGYDTTPNDQIGAGYTGATPEPSTGVMFAMAALILGAVGVRKRNKAQA